MRWVGIYFAGYVLLLIGVIAALVKGGVVDRVGWGWIGIGLIIALGVGVIFAVRVGAPKRSEVDIDRH